MLLRSLVLLASGLPWGVWPVQVPVVGIETNGSPAIRRNVHDLFRSGAEWDLLVQAFTSLQDQAETELTSYFQIMGVHGAPHVGWNGVGQVDGGNPHAGFCPHGEVQFGPWHRPFLVLFERIADMYGGDKAATYRAAAQRVRIPYWDWADDARMPEALSLPRVTVMTPQGEQDVRNPLYSYRFKRPAREAGLPWDILGATYSETKRNPLANGTEDYGHINHQLLAWAPSLKTQVYNVFTQTVKFEEMTTDQFSGSSFESPHNTVHNLAGGGGHLTYLDWSGFDPAFILHHCNVDRLMALWQAINYDNKVFNITARTNGQFGTAPGPVTADSPLRPFFRSTAPGDFHTTRTVADIDRFGYTYPELVVEGNTPLSPQELRRIVIQRVNVLYGGAAPQQLQDGRILSSSSKRSHRRKMTRRAHPRDLKNAVENLHQDVDGGGDGSSGGYGDNSDDEADSQWRTGRDYSVQVQLQRQELVLPATVDLFVCGKQAGQITLLGMPETGASFSVVPLGQVLSELDLPDWSEPTVLALLEKDLKLEVRKFDGTQIPTESIPSLRLEIQSREYTPARNEAEFPKFGAVNNMAIRIAASTSS